MIQRAFTAEQIEAMNARNRAARVKLMPDSLREGKPSGRPRGSKDRKKRKVEHVPSEHEEQCAVVQWWDAWAPAHGYDRRLLFAIPNGSNKSPAARMKFQREGLRAGVPDLMLSISRMDFHGMFIEMKRVRGSVTSDDQLEYGNLLVKRGYRVALCHGADAAIKVIEDYLA
jgi:hypothetical protein